ncbi:hypothetical protein Hdeb2414_s0005g00176021 [Helianthus debilis subsp. tardiflorus]
MIMSHLINHQSQTTSSMKKIVMDGGNRRMDGGSVEEAGAGGDAVEEQRRRRRRRCGVAEDRNEKREREESEGKRDRKGVATVAATPRAVVVFRLRGVDDNDEDRPLTLMTVKTPAATASGRPTVVAVMLTRFLYFDCKTWKCILH